MKKSSNDFEKLKKPYCSNAVISYDEPSLIDAFLRYFLCKTLKPLKLPKQSLDAQNLNNIIESYIRGACCVDPSNDAKASSDNFYEDENPSDTSFSDDLSSSASADEKDPTPVIENTTVDTTFEPDLEIEESLRKKCSSHFEQNISVPSESSVSSDSNAFYMSLGIIPEVITTHDEFITRIQLPENMNSSSFDLGIDSKHTVVRWKTGYTELFIPIPDGLDIDNARAMLKNRTLEIKIPNAVRSSEEEISIRHI